MPGLTGEISIDTPITNGRKTDKHQCGVVNRSIISNRLSSEDAQGLLLPLPDSQVSNITGKEMITCFLINPFMSRDLLDMNSLKSIISLVVTLSAIPRPNLDWQVVNG